VAIDPIEHLRELDATLTSIEKVLDVPTLRREVEQLEVEASAPDLWDDQVKAQSVTSRLSFAQGEINRLTSLRRRLDDVGVMYELADEMGDDQARGEADRELESVS
jgi:peptide chain release factor 2